VSWWATAHVGMVTHAPNGEPLTRDEKLVAFIIADHHGLSTNDAWPSVPRIAGMALMSKRHAVDVLASLERKGFLAKHPGNGRGNVTSYVLLSLPNPPYSKPLEKDAQRAPFATPERVQKGCTTEQKGCKKGAQLDIAIRKEPTEPNEPIEPAGKTEGDAPEFAVEAQSLPFQNKPCRIPKNFRVTAEHEDWARDKRFPDPHDYLDEFVDYWRSRPGAGGVKQDWDATFRTWIRRAVQQWKGSGKDGKPVNRRTASNRSALEAFAENLRRTEAEDRENAIRDG
jgi:hypothetical protein